MQVDATSAEPFFSVTKIIDSKYSKFSYYESVNESSINNTPENSTKKEYSNAQNTNIKTEITYNNKHKETFKLIDTFIQSRQYSRILTTLQDSCQKLSNSDLNFITTKIIPQLGDLGQWSICSDIIKMLENSEEGADIFSYTAMMTALIKNNKNALAIDLFHRMKSIHIHLDEVAYINYVRAAGVTYSWNQILEVLEEAYSVFGDNVLEVTIDVALAVVCKHGTSTEIQEILGKFRRHHLQPTEFTFNTVLGRFASEKKTEEALRVIDTMQSWGILPDETTFNTLLKLYINTGNTMAANQVLQSMTEAGIPADHRTKALLIRFYGLNDDIPAAIAIVDDEPDETVTPHMFSNAITACKDIHIALRLLKRASDLQYADEAVYISAAKCCNDIGQYLLAQRIIDTMLAKGHGINKYTLSFLISMTSAQGKDGILPLVKYLNIASKNNLNNNTAEIITNAICQKVLRIFCINDYFVEALQLHLTVFQNNTCSSDILTTIFTSLQKRIESFDANLFDSKTLSYDALSLLKQYALSSSITKRQLIRTVHFNNVLRMFSVIKEYKPVEEILNIMSSDLIPPANNNENNNNENIVIDNNNNNNNTSATSNSASSSTASSSTASSSTAAAATAAATASSLSGDSSHRWRPSTFTIAEIIRVGRHHKQVELVEAALRWGVKQGAFLPSAVVGDAFSMLFSEGRTDLVLSLYEELYLNELICHWSNRTELTMDLHGYDRGMAFAAMYWALRELSEEERTHGILTVITGTSVMRSKDKDNNNIINNNNNINARSTDPSATETFRLSGEVQRVLVDDFLPPISSYTAPGNPGRILIRLADVKLE
eukprot:gene3691-7347_t